MQFHLLPVEVSDHPQIWGQIIDDPRWLGIISVNSPDHAKEKGLKFLAELSTQIQNLQGKKLLYALQTVFLPPFIQVFSGVVIQGDQLYLFVHRQGTIIMKRGPVIVPLLVKPGVLKGAMLPNDVLLMFNSSTWEKLSSQVTKLTQNLSNDTEIVKAISIWLSEEREQGGVVGGIVSSQRPIAIPSISVEPRPPKKSFALPTIPPILSHVSLQSRQSKAVLLAVVFGLFFITSVILGVRKQLNDSSQKNLQGTIQKVQQLTDESFALESSKPQQSRALLEQAKKELTPFTSPMPKGKEAKDVERLQQTIQESLSRVMKIYTKDASLYFDAAVLSEGRSITAIAPGEQIIGFLDTPHGMIAVLSMERKDAQIIGGGTIEGQPKNIALDGTTVYVLTDAGVVRIPPTTKEPKLILPKDKLSASIDGITVFDGNIYAISKSNGMIDRYRQEAGVYKEKESYFASDVRPDLTKTTNMVIDGSVWFGSSIGKIFKYTQGRDDPFLLQGIDPPLGDTLYIDIPPDSEQVYILDQANHRVVVVGKNGVYKAQYVTKDPLHAQSVIVSESRKRIFLLADQKVYMMVME